MGAGIVLPPASGALHDFLQQRQGGGGAQVETDGGAGAAALFLIDLGGASCHPGASILPPFSHYARGGSGVCTNLAYSLVELTTLRALQSTCTSCRCRPASRALCSDARQPEARAHLQYEGRGALRWPLLDPCCVQQAKTRKVRLHKAKRQEETPRLPARSRQHHALLSLLPAGLRR